MKVKIEKNQYGDNYHILWSDNGYQWMQGFRGTLGKCQIVIAGYVAADCEDATEPELRSTRIVFGDTTIQLDTNK